MVLRWHQLNLGSFTAEKETKDVVIKKTSDNYPELNSIWHNCLWWRGSSPCTCTCNISPGNISPGNISPGSHRLQALIFHWSGRCLSRVIPTGFLLEHLEGYTSLRTTGKVGKTVIFGSSLIVTHDVN